MMLNLKYLCIDMHGRQLHNTMCLPPIDISPMWASFKQCDYEQYAT